MRKKIGICFCNFPATGNEKKNVGAEIGNGLLPKLCSDQGARQLGAGARGIARRGAGCAGRAGRRWGAKARGARVAAGSRGAGAREAHGTGAGIVALACC